MTDSGERESSFEIVEEPSYSDIVPSLVQNVGPLHETAFDPAAPDEPMDPCLNRDSDASKGHETQSIMDLSSSDVSFTQDFSGEAASNLELPGPFTLCSRRPSFEQLRNQRRTRTKHIRQLFSKYPKAIAAESPAQIATHRKFALSAAAVVGIFLALLYVILRDSYYISQLVEELNSVQLQHAKDLLRESRRCPDQAGLIRNMSLEHQHERQNWELEVQSLSQQLKARDAELEKLVRESRADRNKLESDLRTLSDRYREQVAASGETILELQSERRKLMDAAFSAKSAKRSGKTDCHEIKSENEQLKQQMKYLIKASERTHNEHGDCERMYYGLIGYESIWVLRYEDATDEIQRLITNGLLGLNLTDIEGQCDRLARPIPGGSVRLSLSSSALSYISLLA
ncbi:unnamed protein product [Dicrocoelium dendriticum]|nr:unnamed protein product [Dicrocoelium dendriticum]